jgi:hypothetical protein
MSLDAETNRALDIALGNEVNEALGEEALPTGISSLSKKRLKRLNYFTTPAGKAWLRDYRKKVMEGGEVFNPEIEEEITILEQQGIVTVGQAQVQQQPQEQFVTPDIAVIETGPMGTDDPLSHLDMAFENPLISNRRAVQQEQEVNPYDLPLITGYNAPQPKVKGKSKKGKKQADDNPYDVLNTIRFDF